MNVTIALQQRNSVSYAVLVQNQSVFAKNTREVVSSRQGNRDVWRESTHDNTGLAPADLVFGRELRLHCDLLLGMSPYKERPTIDHAANSMDHPHDIHNYTRQRLKLATDRTKIRYDRLANCAGYYESDRVWRYRPTRTKRKSPKLQSSWEGPYKIFTRINDVVYRIQRNPTSRIIVVYMDRLTHYIMKPLGTSGLKEGAVGAVGE
jgi:hypothetical protein